MSKKLRQRRGSQPKYCPHLTRKTKDNGWLGCFLCQRVFYGESIDHAFACPIHPEIVAYRDADAEWRLDCSCEFGDYDRMARFSGLYYTDAADGKRYGLHYTDASCPRCDSPVPMVGATSIFLCGHYPTTTGVPFYKIVHDVKKCSTCPNDVPPSFGGEPWSGKQCPLCVMKGKK